MIATASFAFLISDPSLIPVIRNYWLLFQVWINYHFQGFLKLIISTFETEINFWLTSGLIILFTYFLKVRAHEQTTPPDLSFIERLQKWLGIEYLWKWLEDTNSIINNPDYTTLSMCKRKRIEITLIREFLTYFGLAIIFYCTCFCLFILYTKCSILVKTRFHFGRIYYFFVMVESFHFFIGILKILQIGIHNQTHLILKVL